MKIYWNYIKYMLRHKWYVGIECFKLGLYLHAFTHDLSKFYPSEMPFYAKFYHWASKNKVFKKYKYESLEFQHAWNRHQNRNPHHWQYWVCVYESKTTPLQMPEKYVKQMAADWRGISKMLGRRPLDFYVREKDNMMLHHKTRELLLKYIGG